MMRTGILELWTIQGLNQSLAEGIRFHLKDRKNLNSRVLPHPGSGHFTGYRSPFVNFYMSMSCIIMYYESDIVI